MIRILVYILAMGVSSPTFAVIVKVENIIGKAYVIDNVSPNQAKKEALNQAKKEALRKAGVAENVNAVSSLSTFETGTSFSQYFSEHSLIEISGVIKNYQIVKEYFELNKS